MNILHLNTERTWRGGEQQCLYLLQGLRQYDVTCHLVCQPGAPMETRARDLNIPVFPIRMRSEMDPKAVLQLRVIVKAGRYHIIHSHTSHAHTLAYLATVGIKTLRLVTRRVDFSIFRHSFLHLSGIKYRYMADCYIAISREIKRVLVSDGIPENRIFVVHSGIDTKRFTTSRAEPLMAEFGLGKEERVVLNVAHLAGHKGQAYLLRAVPLVLEKMPTTRFFVVGGGELRSKLSRLAMRLGVKDKVVFTGFRPDVGGFYKMADLFVMSSLQEGLGTALLDALALGVPVVATAAGGITESVWHGKTGRLVPPGDPVALAREIIYMLSHPEEAQKMKGFGRALVQERFSKEAMVRGNVQVYQHILKGQNRT